MSQPDSKLSTILMVDDETAILRMLTKESGRKGIAVLATPPGEAVVELFRQQRREIALVLLDVQMPLPWDGPRTLAALRQIDPDIRVAFMSGSTGNYSSDELLGLGAMCVIDKPFRSLTALFAKLKELIARPRLDTTVEGRIPI